ncbi:hypothetical protein Scep_005471 [Stephania cephalantha]|uniref:DYW domain-containing protein n=1 Tax=Stephania cephalantha TaxID=152367 RepID=A0AAP0KW33_9MAGN
MWALNATLHPLHPHHFPPKPSITSSLQTTNNNNNNNNNNNHLIQTLSKQGHTKRALQLLSTEPRPTQRTYELLILSCTRADSVSDAVAVHRALIDDGLHRDPFLATKLIDAYAQLGSVHNARYVFDEMRERRTVFVWNAFIRALALAGRGDEALGVCCQMSETGVCFDRFTYTYALKACVVGPGSGSGERKGKEIHGSLLRRGFEWNVHIATTLIDLYAKFGLVSYAGKVFDEMPVRNVVSWSAMIGCLAKNGRPFEALELFWEMMVGNPDEVPNSVTMVSVLQACAALSALGQGKLIHCFVVRRGLDSILPVNNSLVTMYSKCGNLEMARRVFDRMDRRDVVSWNSMISGYGVHGFAEEAIMVFKEMINDGRVSPNAVTFISLLGACSHSGLVDEGKRLFYSMVPEYHIYPSSEHYAGLVDILGRAGRLEEAMKVIEDMRIEPGSTVWGSLLGACRIHCNIEFAERASVRLFELEPTNAGNYVLLADIYAEAKMWEEVNRVKKLLEARGLQKVSGCSWIEVKGKIYSFVSVDELNPQIEQLHALLVKFSLEMKEKGYVPDTKAILYELDEVEKEEIVLGHSEKLAVAFGLINSSAGETIRITKNLRLCQDCHSVTKFISQFTNREILVRDVNRFHHFKNGVCSCGDYW